MEEASVVGVDLHHLVTRSAVTFMHTQTHRLYIKLCVWLLEPALLKLHGSAVVYSFNVYVGLGVVV